LLQAKTAPIVVGGEMMLACSWAWSSGFVLNQLMGLKNCRVFKIGGCWGGHQSCPRAQSNVDS